MNCTKEHVAFLKSLTLGIVLLFCASSFLNGQSATQLSGKSLIELRRANIEAPNLSWNRSILNSTLLINTAPTLPHSLLNAHLLQPNHTPNAYSYQDLAFFCKLEVQMEKKARFPIKFRLGEVQYVDRLEGKTQPLNQIE